VVDLRNSTVESNNVNSVVGGIENQILSHDSEANKAEISSRSIVSMLSFVGCVRDPARGPADVDAGKAHTARSGRTVVRRNSFANEAGIIYTAAVAEAGSVVIVLYSHSRG
jgi:hypothetical protein